MIWRGAQVAVLVLATAGCAQPLRNPPPPTTPADEARYATTYPLYAEVCALSQLGKKEGFGVELFSGIGGHAGLYLNGACRRQDTPYPVLQPCDESPGQRADGVGLSVNAHYANAEWVASEGRAFFFDGDLQPGEALTREGYARLQAKALAKGVYSGVDFKPEALAPVPSSFSPEAAKYEVSVATDYAIGLGRNRYCARVPLSRPQLVAVIDYLNGLNQPYRDGGKVFEWNVLSHNCSHINHNALTAAGVWEAWPMDRLKIISAFDFPVPKNEFINLLRRLNDYPIDDLDALYDDDFAREAFLRHDRLPSEPGAIVDLGIIAAPNEVYATESRIIFYDEPLTGRYQRRYNAMLGEPRYLHLRDNLAWFAGRYRMILDQRKPLAWYVQRRRFGSEVERAAFTRFHARYFDYIARRAAEVARQLATLPGAGR